jgi:hypothetical protein
MELKETQSLIKLKIFNHLSNDPISAQIKLKLHKLINTVYFHFFKSCIY